VTVKFSTGFLCKTFLLLKAIEMLLASKTCMYMRVSQNFSFKAVEHSFQVPMPNSPLLLKLFMLWCPCFARVKVNHRSVYSCILSKVCAIAMAMGLVKNKA